MEFPPERINMVVGKMKRDQISSCTALEANSIKMTKWEDTPPQELQIPKQSD